MLNILVIVIFISFVFLLVGLIYPPAGLFWYKKEKTRNNVVKFYGASMSIGLLCLIIFKPDAPKANFENETSKTQEPVTETQETTGKVKVPQLGETLHTTYFDVKVNHVTVSDHVSTGNEYYNELYKTEQGSMFLIINVSFKNTDNVSRMVEEGSVFVNYNGKNYENDHAETLIIENGWGLFFDQINPLTTKTTNLVYKISSELKEQPAYWNPGRSNQRDIIYLGKL